MRRLFTFLLITVITGCVEPYNPPKTTSNGFLVVNGVVNTLSGSAEILLSRTQSLTNNELPPSVSGAQVYIESEGGEIMHFNENSIGVYALNSMDIEPLHKYRLRIDVDGHSYGSNFVDVTSVPPIDSVTWRVVDNEVLIRVNSHDPDNETRFYLWQLSETWIYNSFIPSHFWFENGQVFPREIGIHYCWKTDPGTDILVESTSHLSEDVVTDFPLKQISLGSPKFRIRYSVLVSQQGVTQEAYLYWQKLKENIRETGGLFDVQPSRITGNIRSMTNAEEPVLGYFSMGEIRSQRIFIANRELPKTGLRLPTGYEHCKADTLLLEDVAAFAGDKLLGTSVRLADSDKLIGYLISTSQCIDCRLAGGLNVKPDFWD